MSSASSSSAGRHRPSHRVLATGRRLALILDGAAERLVHLPAPHPSSPHVVCGDEVVVDGDRVLEVLPRRSVLARARRHLDDPGGTQLIAANVDVVGICAPLDRPFRAGFVERALALAHAGGARPLILLTKRDAALELDGALAEAASVAAGADVVAVSAFDPDDLAVLQALAPAPETVVLLGQSGAGKSTLTNALLGRTLQDVGAVRTDDHRGRHTTTRTRLVPLPWGAFLIDTPGVRTLGLAADDEDVDAVFPEIEEAAVACRFRDCAHDTEPGCAVRAAVDEGRLEAARLSSWRKLRAELERTRAKMDPLAATSRKRAERALSNAAWSATRAKRW